MLLPLSMIIVVSMLKDAYEDYQRHLKDTEENDSICEVITDKEGKRAECKWKQIKVGDTIKVYEG